MRVDHSDGKKVWWLFDVCVGREAEELAGSLLFDLGARGIVTLEEGADRVRLGAYFDPPLDVLEIERAIFSALSITDLSSGGLSVSASEVPDQDWMQKWKEGFEPIEVGNRLIVAPSWKLPDPGEGRTVIQIDPGMAFGTGTHETTRLCLDAIERYWRGGRLLDVGTGTGILAIAAALLQPDSRVTAVDIDPQAVEVARENVAANAASGIVTVVEGQPARFVGGRFDMVVANLTAEVIIELMSDLAGCLGRSGLMVLSGILTVYVTDVEHAAALAGLDVIERREAGEWSALVARMGKR